MCVKNLFKNLPVRKQYHNAAKKKKDELKRIEDLLIAYGIICPDVRISLRHNKEQIWQKVSLPDSAAVLQSVLGRQIMSQMEWRKTESTDLEVSIPPKTVIKCHVCMALIFNIGDCKIKIEFYSKGK